MAKAKSKVQVQTNIVSEGKVCRAIIDRNEVMASQVLTTVMENLGSKASQKDYADLKKQLDAVVAVHTDGLVKQVSKMFSDK